jgi:N-glycosylase/DNA lyase
MNKFHLPNFNLEKTLLGGQAFSWEKIGDIYYGKTIDKVIKIKRDGENIFWQTFPVKDDFDFIKKYFRLNIDYETLLQKINVDEKISISINTNPGLRLLKQDFDQTLISFIVSQNSNIPKIRKSLNILSEKFGDKLKVDNLEFNLFPKIVRLHESSIEELLESRIGYRAPYIKRSTEQILQNNLLEEIEKLDFDNAKSELLKLHGIGDKVADCILVFSLAQDHITPLDVWGRRVISQIYGIDERMKYTQMMAFLNKKFGEHTSWAGQFLFEYVRSHS